MDNLTEYLIKKNNTPKENAIRLTMWLLIVLLIGVIGVILTFISEYLIYMLPVVAVFLVYIALKMNKKFYIEFEYVLTNGYFDIDKIVSRSDRSNVVSFSLSSVDSFGRYTGDDCAERGFKNRHFTASSSNSDNLWYVTYDDENKGRTLVIFEANDKMLTHIKTYVPTRAIKN